MLMLAGSVVDDRVFLQKTGPLDAVRAKAVPDRIYCLIQVFQLFRTLVFKQAHLHILMVADLACPESDQPNRSQIPELF